MTEKQEIKIYNFILSQEDTFGIEDILDNMNIKPTGENMDIVDLIIKEVPLIFINNGKMIPKSKIIKKIPFRIHPQDEEIFGNYLILGHRILPFNNNKLEIDSFKLVYNGNQIPRITKQFKMSDAEKYYLFLNGYQLPFLENIDDFNPENKDDFSDLTVKIEAYDMKNFYNETRFKFGDSIVVNTVDYINGIYNISCDNFTDRDEVKDINNYFLKSLRRILKEGIDYPTVEKQLLYVYYDLKKNIKKIPPHSPAKIFRLDQTITISSFPDGRRVLHFKDDDITEMMFDSNAIESKIDQMFVDPSELNSIDSILKFLGNNYNKNHITSLILDQLSFDKFNYDKLLEFIFHGKEDYFYDDKNLEVKFKKYVEKEYIKVKLQFDKNPTTLPVNVIRRKFLDKVRQITDFLRYLDGTKIDLDQLPKKEMMEFASLNQQIDQFLFFFNKNKISKNDLNNFEFIENFIKMLDDIIPNIIGNIKSLIKKKKR